jgi:hypothetical protein
LSVRADCFGSNSREGDGLQPRGESIIVAAVSNEPENFNVPTWKCVAALVIVLVAVLLGTLVWMWRDTKPRRRPALLGAPEITRTNPVPATPAQ